MTRAEGHGPSPVASPATSASTAPGPDRPRGAVLRVNEIFASLQGEGPSTGEPAAFLRLAGCNLSCAWCDTAYAWDFARHDPALESHPLPPAAVAERLLATGERRLVITGGEPLLQQPALAALLSALPRDLLIEVETNGTIAPEAVLLARVTRWVVSPKLQSAGAARAVRLREDLLRAFATHDAAWCKLVVANDADLAEADALVAALGWPHARVLLMPEASDRETLAARWPWVAAAAAARRFGVSTRLQVERWGGARGR